MQERLVVAGLELLGHDEHAVLGSTEDGRGLALGDTVHRGFGVLDALVVDAPREGHERLRVGVALLAQVGVDGALVADGMEAAARDHHGLALAADPVAGVGTEVLDDDLGLLGEVVGMERHEARDRAARLAGVVLGIVGHRLADLPVRRIGRVVREHVEDEALLDGLAHGVEMEGREPVLGVLAAEELERARLGRRGEGEERQVRLATARDDLGREGILGVGRNVSVASATSASSSCASADAEPRAALRSLAASPVWEEWASSTMTAKRSRPRSATFSSTKGNFCSVVMTMRAC